MCFTVQLSRFLSFFLSATAFILEQSCFCLSRTFLTFFKVFCFDYSSLLFPTACIFYHISKSLSTTFLFFLCCRSFAATLISYHVCRFLSTTFFSAIYSVGAQYHLALSDQNCSARVSFVIIPPSSNFVNQKLQIKLYSDNLCCILKLLYHAFYFSHNTRNSYHIAYA